MKTINVTQAAVNDYYKLPPDSRVGDTFRVNHHSFITVTDEQAASFENLLRRQGRDLYLDAFYNHLDDYLAVRFEQLYVGIEPDGYTHS